MPDKWVTKFRLFDHGTRTCICGCGEVFRPVLTIGPDCTEFYASAYCAITALKKQENWPLPPAGSLVTAFPQRGAIKQEKRALKAAKDALKGPYREIEEVLKTFGDDKKSGRCRLTCGHIRRCQIKKGKARCRKCLAANSPTPTTEEE